MLILALLLRAFQPPKPASRGCATVFPPGLEQEPLHLLCSQCSVGLHNVAQIPFSGFGGRKVGAAWVRSAWSRFGILEVLRLRAHKRRFAQDDDFVASLTKKQRSASNKVRVCRQFHTSLRDEAVNASSTDSQPFSVPFIPHTPNASFPPERPAPFRPSDYLLNA